MVVTSATLAVSPLPVLLSLPPNGRSSKVQLIRSATGDSRRSLRVPAPAADVCAAVPGWMRSVLHQPLSIFGK